MSNLVSNLLPGLYFLAVAFGALFVLPPLLVLLFRYVLYPFWDWVADIAEKVLGDDI